MATIDYVEDIISPKVRLVRWPNMANGDVGEPYAMGAYYPDKCIQISGTWGSGGTIVIKGSNEFADPAEQTPPSSYLALKNVQGSTLTFTSASNLIEQIQQNPYWLRPEVTAGDGTTSLTATLLIKG